jgi:hypothetical protein
MPATVIVELVGWTRGMTVFKERVRELRPAYLPPDRASRTTHYSPPSVRYWRAWGSEWPLIGPAHSLAPQRDQWSASRNVS